MTTFPGPGATDPPSPCIHECRVDPAHGYCRGCWRTQEEIRHWKDLGPMGQQAIRDAMASRRAGAATVAVPAPPR